MHALHRILVNTVNLMTNYPDRETQTDNIRTYAESETDAYAGSTFDWRTTDDAGGWKDEYPVNVLFASDNIDAFLEEIKKSEDSANAFTEYLKKQILPVSDSVPELIEYVEKKDKGHMVAYYMEMFGKMHNGTYCFDSAFFDTEDGTARITPETYEKVRNNPNDYALVLFDYHN